MTKLKLTDDLTLPLDACTQTFAWIGRKGSGKTYGAGKMVEELLDHHVQTVILDTVGNWYGLRLQADGLDTAYGIPVFGGLRQDLPLLSTAGEVVADVVVDSGRSVILDVSQFNFSERKRFAADFGTRLWQRKKGESQPSPLHLVIEECQLIVPQFVGKDETRMVHVYEEIIRLGRNYGIGASMITQRPQSVNKEVLTQAECIMAFQLNGVPERKALKDWLTYEGGDVNLVNELPGLPVGTCYLWSPQWLRKFEKITIAKKWTLDASATPKMGAKAVRREPQPLDVKDIAARMASTIEKAKADDPKELRRQIDKLRLELNLARKLTPAQSEPIIKQVPALKDGQLKRIEDVTGHAQRIVNQFSSVVSELREALAKVANNISAKRTIESRDIARADSRGHGIRVTNHSVGDPGSTAPLSKMARTMLTVLAQHPDGLTKSQVLVHAEYRSSGPVSTTFAQMVTNGWVAMGGGKMMMTSKGLSELGPYDPLPTGDALLQHLLNGSKLSKMEKALLNCIAEAYPREITKGEVLEKARYASSGPVSSAFAKLVACNYVNAMGSSLLKLAEELA